MAGETQITLCGNLVDDPELAATIVAAVNGQPDLSTSHKEARTNV